MHKYAPYYCEENIWWLAQEPSLADRAREVVFVSNAHRTCALFDQRAAPAPGAPVIWDYHVVLAVYEPTHVEVWDLDSASGAPLPAATWIERSFQPAERLPKAFHPRFRVLAADELVATFSSDRSHMRDASGLYLQPPPPWPCVERGASNLQRLVDMDDGFMGDVLDVARLRARWTTVPPGA